LHYICKKNVHAFDIRRQITIIAAKAIESWFLADSETLSDLFNEEYEHVNPENIEG